MSSVGCNACREIFSTTMCLGDVSSQWKNITFAYWFTIRDLLTNASMSNGAPVLVYSVQCRVGIMPLWMVAGLKGLKRTHCVRVFTIRTAKSAWREMPINGRDLLTNR